MASQINITPNNTACANRAVELMTLAEQIRKDSLVDGTNRSIEIAIILQEAQIWATLATR